MKLALAGAFTHFYESSISLRLSLVMRFVGRRVGDLSLPSLIIDNEIRCPLQPFGQLTPSGSRMVESISFLLHSVLDAKVADFPLLLSSSL